MRNQLLGTLATLSALALVVGCSAPTTTSVIPDSQARDDGGPPSQDVESADASAPPEVDAGKCGGFPFNDKACGTCAATSCCAAAASCMGDAECNALSSCLDACSDAACADRCTNLHASGITKFNAIGTCVGTKCSAECSTTPPTPTASKGIGDRCASDAECRDGSCAGTPGWCTKSCTQHYDCKGYPQINNEFAKFNYCLETANGANACFPGCSTNSDCAKYASDLTCQNAGNGIYVCSR